MFGLSFVTKFIVSILIFAITLLKEKEQVALI